MDPFENPYATSPGFPKDQPTEHPDPEKDFDRVLYSLSASRFLVTSIVVLMGIKAAHRLVMIALGISMTNWSWAVSMGVHGIFLVGSILLALVEAIVQTWIFFILMRYRSVLKKMPHQPVARTVFIALEKLRGYWKVLTIVLVVEVLSICWPFFMSLVVMYV